MSFNSNGFSEEKHRINRAINVARVRVISPSGEALGVMSINEALKAAAEYSLDLVEVSPQADPPVCKILDYGKLKYDMQKKKAEAKKKQKVIEIKEVKFTPMIGANDMKIKIAAIQRFIAAGNKVKVSLRFRGRELSHQEVGERVLRQVLSATENIAKPDGDMKLEGKQMVTTLSPIAMK